MSTDPLVIMDDDSDAFSYGPSLPGGAPWDLISDFQWYRGTSHAAIWNGTATFTFNGTFAAFIGNSPQQSFPPFTTVQIDNGDLSNVGNTDLTGYNQWFTTPPLPDGKHTITVRGARTASIDYAVVKVGSQTSLTGHTVIVDDDSSLIRYSGQWSRNTNMAAYSYGNVIHRSSNPGDTFTFRFSGTSIAIYGIFSWNNIGLLSVTCSIDGTPYPTSSVNTSSQNHLTGEVPNHLYFSLDSLSYGPHTLLVNITEANNLAFVLDYITYKPAFDTLSSLSGKGDTDSTSGSQKSISAGALVGGIFGGVAFGVFVTILALILRQRRARKQRYAYPGAALHHGSDTNGPNILNPYVSNSFQMQGHQYPI